MVDRETDLLSQLAHDIIHAGSYQKLTVSGPAPAKTGELLRGVTPDQLLSVPIVESAHAHALLAGLWLWHDGLSEAHEVVQDPAPFLHQTPWKASQNVRLVQHVEIRNSSQGDILEAATSTYALWHAIMHRREGDFFNAKYWYARCRHHPALAHIPSRAEEDVEHKPDLLAFDRVVRGGSWDGAAFVDLVEDVYQDEADPRFTAVVRLQRLEWRVLFEHCARAAAGRP